MNKLDAVILFAIDGDQPECGLALFSIPHDGDLAVAGQDSNGTVASNFFIRELDGAKEHGMNLEIIQNLRLGERCSVGSHEHIVIGVDLRQLLQIVLPQGSIEIVTMGAPHFLGCYVHESDTGGMFLSNGGHEKHWS